MSDKNGYTFASIIAAEFPVEDQQALAEIAELTEQGQQLAAQREEAARKEAEQQREIRLNQASWAALGAVGSLGCAAAFTAGVNIWRKRHDR